MSQFTRRSLIIFILLIAATLQLRAQRQLTNSRQSSYYTYIYKITPGEVVNFYRSSNYTPDDKVLQHPLDSFKTDKYWENNLSTGNFLKVSAEKNTLKYELIENHTAFLKLTDDASGHSFVLLHKDGIPISHAIVTINNRRVVHDSSGVFKIKHPKKKNIVRADYAGISNFFIIQKEGYDPDEPLENRLKSWWRSVKNLFKRSEKLPNYYGYHKNYSGFFVFNKPKYKPLDTVKFKAFILDRKSNRPVKNKHLLVRLTGPEQKEITISPINSYRDGAFEYSFVLNDSLKLVLDQNYAVNLVEPKAQGKDRSNARNGIDEEGHKILVSAGFHYEEYELKSIRLTARIDKPEHVPGDKPAIYLKATDENDLPVPDGRVKLTMTAGGATNFGTDRAFVPDTLWTYQLKLDAIGETKVMIPDSIFPKANLNYTIYVEFLNSSNERQSDYIYGTFKNERYTITANLNGDTLNTTYKYLGKELKAAATIIALDANQDTLSKTKVMLPSKTRFNPYVTTYNIKTDSTDFDFDVEKQNSKISLSAVRTADSLFVSVDNPRGIKFWYTVYADGKDIYSGQSRRLFYKRAWNNPKAVGLQVNYIWGGQVVTTSTAAAYQKVLLNINVKQPVSVYPGQRAETVIAVTDADGKPVSGVDLTAWSVTRKFSYANAPALPYFGDTRTRYADKRFETTDVNRIGVGKLNWSRWSREMGLDSIAYYQFTRTKSIYQREEPGIDTITQIAPFIVQDGDIIPVHILYIDEKPVYFSQAQQLQQYSFIVSPGMHSLRFRTSHQNIKLDSVCVEASKKLILGLNADYLPSIKQPDTLSTYEAELINKYMITMVDNFNEKKAVIRQNEKVFFLNPQAYVKREILAGPLTDNYAVFNLQGEKPRSFITEPGYSYLFEPGLLKQKSIDTKYPFRTKLSTANGTRDYTQYALTETRVDSLWQDYIDQRNSEQELFANRLEHGMDVGKLVIERKLSKDRNDAMIKNIIIYKYDDRDFALIYPGRTTMFYNLTKGRYRLFFLLKGDNYDIKENIEIKSHGINYFKMHIDPVHARDSVSIKISNIINARTSKYAYSDSNIENDALKIKEAFNEKFIDAKAFGAAVSGTVIASDDRLPLVGVMIRVKGTTTGAVTDVNGRFYLRVPANGKFIITYVGFQVKEVNFTPGIMKPIVLEAANMALHEVVVTGYQTTRKKDISGAVYNINDALSGKVAGVSVRSQLSAPGAGAMVTLRGASGFGNGQGAIYVVDGVIMPNVDRMDINTVGTVTVLSGAAASALYGSQGANGVIVITTSNKKGNDNGGQIQPASPENSLRKNFSDYAYWQPKLITDENGKASFTTVFPDDITNWRTFVIGINGKKQAGFNESQIKSFKPLNAAFLSPAFAVEGDEPNTLGKVTNYASEPATLTRTFTFNGKQLRQDVLNVTNSKIDTLNITAPNTDSLTFEYSIKRDNGYFDGERRKIPVIKQGIKETNGIFEALKSDTTVSLKFDAAKGPVTFRAEASVLPALMEEAQKLSTYKYLCNEQLASKLKGLLMEKRIKKFIGEEFKYEKNISEVIKKLQENRKTQGTWGWWKDSDEELWISLHVIGALVDAQKDGYQIQLDKQKLTDYLVYQMESYKGQDKLVCLQLLHELGAKIDYQKYFTVIEKENARAKEIFPLYTASNYDKFRLMLLKQEAGATVNLDSLLAGQHRTMFGNIYWGEDSYRFFDNSIQLTVLAYQIIKNEGKHNGLLPKIQGYFLEQRRTGNWRNTYESALILETILPDVLTADKQTRPAALIIKGSKTETITQFPYTATLTDNEITVSKTGTLPVYITGYQQFWNTKPEKTSKDFTVDTWFEKKDQHLTKLKGGETVELKAEINARGDADFVMIEIPIPAGCSYESKEQSWQNNEVHREYFKEKVSIFCRKLKQGKYEFTINLTPRYNGKYNLNPAKAEMMYFPVFYGREGIKKVVIGE